MQKHLKVLARRAKHLWGKLDGMPDYGGRLYDQAEYEALDWALEGLGAALTMPAPEQREPVEDDAAAFDAFDDSVPPPRIPGSHPPRSRERVRVPSEPRGKRYYPHGDL